LDLQNGVVTGLGRIELETGEYTQLRLIIGTESEDTPNILCHDHPFANYVVDMNDNELMMNVPSGEQTGVKIVCGGLCVVNENETTELILDFDAAESVVITGSGKINLKPTIKVLSTEEHTLLTGNVAEGETGVSGATVSAQIYDPGASDAKDEVVVLAAVATDNDGNYRLLLKPDDYNIVVTALGFEPAAIDFTAVAGAVDVEDFSLDSSDTGTVSGLVTITSAVDPTYAHTSFRLDAVLAGEVVEIASVVTLNGDTYSVDLPVSPSPDYDVISSTCGKPTIEESITVIADTDTVLDLVFP
jgi:hypothetical protein